MRSPTDILNFLVIRPDEVKTPNDCRGNVVQTTIDLLKRCCASPTNKSNVRSDVTIGNFVEETNAAHRLIAASESLKEYQGKQSADM